jgi:hypothetical protein
LRADEKVGRTALAGCSGRLEAAENTLLKKLGIGELLFRKATIKT